MANVIKVPIVSVYPPVNVKGGKVCYNILNTVFNPGICTVSKSNHFIVCGQARVLTTFPNVTIGGLITLYLLYRSKFTINLQSILQQKIKICNKQTIYTILKAILNLVIVIYPIKLNLYQSAQLVRKRKLVKE